MNFERENFRIDGMYVSYDKSGNAKTWGDFTFVARFKYRGRDKGSFITFLIKNFTVEEYFGRIDSGESPGEILKSKGYVAASIKRDLKRAGYAPTLEGYDAYIKAQVEKYQARTAS